MDTLVAVVQPPVTQHRRSFFEAVGTSESASTKRSVTLTVRAQEGSAALAVECNTVLQYALYRIMYRMLHTCLLLAGVSVCRVAERRRVVNHVSQTTRIELPSRVTARKVWLHLPAVSQK